MPKRGGRGNYTDDGFRLKHANNYSQHDDRDRDRDQDRSKERRRVSFKPSGPVYRWGDGDKDKKKWLEMAIRTRLEDDEVMGDFASTSKQYDERGVKPIRKGSPIPKGKFGNFRKLMQTPFGWYQVSVQSGQRYSKDDILRALLSVISPDVIIPHYWRTDKNSVVFFVDDFKMAERLQMIDRSIQMPDGYRLFLRVRGGCPIVSVDEEFKEKMKIVMANRYNATTRALDMSRFHADPLFKNMFCGLFRTPVMSAAIDIIAKNIPDLVALNLSDNSISSLESFKDLGERLPYLRVLYLDDNKLPSLAHLLVLRQVPIVELRLKGNPLRMRYKDQPLYVSEVRRKFPKLVKLDGFNLEALPKPKASFLCDNAGAEIIRQFMEQYFVIFDSENRQPLLNAYHEHAMLSMCVPPINQAGRLNSFWKFNRNLKRSSNNDESNKIRNLKIGRLAVVSLLADWPKTQHDPTSFTVDLTLFTEHLITFTVAGLFKEFEATTSNPTSGGEVRYFQRQYVVVPTGVGFCIRNELIFVTSASAAQARNFLKSRRHITSTVVEVHAPGTPPPTAALQNRLQLSQSPTSVVQIPGTVDGGATMLQQQPVPQAQPTVVDEATKLQMIQAMSAQSNMNVEWSKKCLEETNWDYNHAAFVFEKLHKENKIPPEAYL